MKNVTSFSFVLSKKNEGEEEKEKLTESWNNSVLNYLKSWHHYSSSSPSRVSDNILRRFWSSWGTKFPSSLKMTKHILLRYRADRTRSFSFPRSFPHLSFTLHCFSLWIPGTQTRNTVPDQLRVPIPFFKKIDFASPVFVTWNILYSKRTIFTYKLSITKI